MTYHPGLFDYAVVALAILFNLIELCLVPVFKRAAAHGSGKARPAAYIFFMAEMWTLVACVAALWLATGRSWNLLLLGTLVPWRLAAGLAAAAALIFLIARDRRTILRRPEIGERLIRQQAFAGFVPFLPRTPPEHLLFMLVSVTAGCAEEFLCRGFLLALTSSLVGVIFAVPITSLLFGLGHGYQGGTAILKTGAFGVVTALIALAAGSLIPVILIHIAMDLVTGDLGYRVLSSSPAGGDALDDAALSSATPL